MENAGGSGSGGHSTPRRGAAIVVDHGRERRADSGRDRGRQLLRRQLSAVLGLDAARRWSATRGPRSHAPPAPGVPLGLYLHIPFCRKRCHFCYFRVYTDKNAQRGRPTTSTCSCASGSSTREQPAIAGPAARLRLLRRRHAVVPLDAAARGPGRAAERRSRPGRTPRRSPSSASRARSPRASSRRSGEMGVTRLSLGVENFDDRILELNGRAHRSREIDRAYDCARALGFPQINIDLIAGHARRDRGELARRASRRRSSSTPDSVTIYQMELPFNTTISGDLLKGTRPVRRAGGRLGDQAALGARRRSRRSRRAGYHVGSAYTAVKDPARTQLRLPRPALAGRRPGRPGRRLVRPRQRRARAEPRHLGDLQSRRSSAASCRSAARTGPTDEERMIRELVLQLKRGSIRPRLLPRQVRRGRARALSRTPLAVAARRRLPAPRPTPSRGADARGAAARRRAAAALLPARARGDPLHLAAVQRAVAGRPTLLGAGVEVFEMSTIVRSLPRHAARRATPRGRSRDALSARRRLRAGGDRAAAHAAEIAPERIPPPYRSLLVHERDMTLTLEAHFGGRVSAAGAVHVPRRRTPTSAACCWCRSTRRGRSRWARSASTSGVRAPHPRGDPAQPRPARARAARRRRRLPQPPTAVPERRRRTPR